MPFRVVTLPRAEADVAESAAYISADSPNATFRWLEGLEAAIQSPAELPFSAAKIPETGRFTQSYRQIHYHSHRIVFFVDEEAAVVVVARVYHSAQDQLRASDLSP